MVIDRFRQSLFSLLISMPKPLGFCHAFVDRSQTFENDLWVKKKKRVSHFRQSDTFSIQHALC